MEAKMYQVMFLRKNGTRREIRTVAKDEIAAMEFALKWTQTPIREVQELTSEPMEYEKGQELIRLRDEKADEERKVKIQQKTKNKNEKLELEEDTQPTDYNTDGGGGDARNNGDDGVHNNAPSGAERGKRKSAKG